MDWAYAVFLQIIVLSMMNQYLFNKETVCTYIYINYHSGIYTIWPFSLKLNMYRYAMEWLQHDLSVSISLNTNQIPMQERLTIYTCQVPTDETSIGTRLHYFLHSRIHWVPKLFLLKWIVDYVHIYIRFAASFITNSII